MTKVTVYAPASAIDTRDQGLEPLMYRAMQFGKAREIAPREVVNGEDVEMAVVRDLNSDLISASDVTGILSVPGARVENYPCFAEVPEALLEDDVPFDVPGIAVLDEDGIQVTEEVDGEQVPVADVPRKWNQMPNYRVINDVHYVTLAVPITNRVTATSRRNLSGSQLKQALEAGVTLIDEKTMRSLVTEEV